ncbi:hypothetical protein [Deinococcus sp. QL22]|uniref:hypothetical protein n=1 Tax=Deinococcus sp. QL22 TaxID=2939437 RepID=UPI00201766E8|nr:hypothetical protein [Deinococcus sp. QL22]UQN07968.1 hypothetical protein M1R55_17880 [Deinococcus sp. QL22]
MTKKIPAKFSRVHVVHEHILEILDGPVLNVRFGRGMPDGHHRDLTLTARAYRAVVATTETTEVLSPCGHERPRFDLSPAFQQLLAQVGPQFPRSRLCPHCQQHPHRAALVRVAHQEDEAADLQLASDWGAMTKGERELARPLLEPLRGHVPGLPDVAGWITLTPQERRQIALAGEAFAEVLGLTFRELLSLKPTPAPTITTAGLKRLKATPQEKARRAQRRDDAAYRRELERQRG